MFCGSSWIIGLNKSEQITQTGLLKSNGGENMVRSELGGSTRIERERKRIHCGLGRSSVVWKMWIDLYARINPTINGRSHVQSLVGPHSTLDALVAQGARILHTRYSRGNCRTSQNLRTKAQINTWFASSTMYHGRWVSCPPSCS